MKQLGRWVIRHRTLGAWLHLALHRRRFRYSLNRSCVICSAVWAALPESTLQSVRQGIADVEAGRWYSYNTETGESTPNPDWPVDGDPEDAGW